MSSTSSSKVRALSSTLLRRLSVTTQQQQQQTSTARTYSALLLQTSKAASSSSLVNNSFGLTTNSQRRWLSDTFADSKEKAAAEEYAEKKNQKEEVIVEETTEGADDTTTTTDTAAASEQQIKELKDQLLRSLAEQENTRRIAQRDVESARQFAIKSFAKSLLDTADNLERALQAANMDEEKSKSSDNSNLVKNLYEGIQMTHQGLIKAFAAHGLAKFGQEGDPFDPNQHEALYEYPDANKTPGTVGQVIKPGFLLNKRVLRPAEVGVIKK